MDTKLSFKSHCDSIVLKARKTLGFINRVTRPFRNPDSILTLYASLVRSIVEYCSVVWSPHYSVHIDKIESVQRKFVKQLCGRFRLKIELPLYEDRLKKFNLETLQVRRKICDLCTLYKIVNSVHDTTLLRQILFKVQGRSNRRQHLFKIPLVTNNVSQHSPIPRMCSLYNEHNKELDIFLHSLITYKHKVKSLYKHT